MVFEPPTAKIDMFFGVANEPRPFVPAGADCIYTLKELQTACGGHVELVRREISSGDRVAFVCNEEARLRGMALNRGVLDAFDVEIFGPVIVVYNLERIQ